MGKTTISRNIPYPHFWRVGGKFSLGVAFVICTDLLVPFYLDSILTLCINPWRSDNSLRGAPAPAGADAEISPAIPSMSFYPSSGREEAIFLIGSMSRNKLADISTYCTTLYDVSRALQQRSEVATLALKQTSLRYPYEPYSTYHSGLSGPFGNSSGICIAFAGMSRTLRTVGLA
jgi:hypothetical protein